MKVTVEMTKEEFLDYVKIQEAVSSLKYQIKLVQDKIQTTLVHNQDLNELLLPIYQDLDAIKNGSDLQ